MPSFLTWGSLLPGALPPCRGAVRVPVRAPPGSRSSWPASRRRGPPHPGPPPPPPPPPGETPTRARPRPFETKRATSSRSERDRSECWRAAKSFAARSIRGVFVTPGVPSPFRRSGAERLTPPGAPGGEDTATALRLHAGPEAMLLGAVALLGLVRLLHRAGVGSLAVGPERRRSGGGPPAP